MNLTAAWLRGHCHKFCYCYCDWRWSIVWRLWKKSLAAELIVNWLQSFDARFLCWPQLWPVIMSALQEWFVCQM